MTHPKKPKKKREIAPVSLAGLDFDTAVRASLATGKAPPPPKKPRGKK